MINCIRNKAIYVAIMLYLSLKHHESISDFSKIIQMAMDKINGLHRTVLIDFVSIVTEIHLSIQLVN